MSELMYVITIVFGVANALVSVLLAIASYLAYKVDKSFTRCIKFFGVILGAWLSVSFVFSMVMVLTDIKGFTMASAHIFYLSAITSSITLSILCMYGDYKKGA